MPSTPEKDALTKHCQRGDIRSARAVLSAWSGMVNVADHQGETPLHVAVSNDHSTIAELLLDHKADVNATDSNQETPLHRAVELGTRDDIVTLLVRAGANVNAADSRGETPLHRAVKLGFRQADASIRIFDMDVLVDELLKGENIDVDAQDIHGRSALHLAMEAEDEDLVKTLVTKGANVNLKDYGNSTPLLHAVRRKRPAMVQALLSHSSCKMNTESRDGYTPLLRACEDKEEEIVRMLLRRNANVDFYSTKQKTTALHTALRRQTSTSVIKCMVDNAYDMEIQDGWGLTPLILAFELNQNEAVLALLQRGANINSVDYSSSTALHRATARGDAGLVVDLLRSNVDVNTGDFSGCSALHLACQAGHTGIARVLIQHGAGLSATDVAGIAPLEYLGKTVEVRKAALGWLDF